MLVSLHRPEIKEISTLTHFHVVTLSDESHRGGSVDVYVEEDWSDWDAVVRSVEDYRRTGHRT